MDMNRGKDICKELKELRRKIAEENDIPLEIKECTYEGPCRGTCPRCESEVRFLENELAKRLRMGKVATVTGLALTLGVSGNAAAQAVDTIRTPHVATEDVTRKPFSVRLTGVIKDSLTGEPLPFVNVVIKQDGKMVTGGTTDFDGVFTIAVPAGVLDLEILTVGYNKYVRTGVTIPEGKKRVEMDDVILAWNGAQLMEGIIIEGASSPIIEIGPEGGTNTEIQGIPLRIQY